MILVPIDMPQNCGCCYFLRDYDEGFLFSCLLLNENANPYMDERLGNCPLIDAVVIKEEK